MKLSCTTCNYELNTQDSEHVSQMALIHFGHDVKFENTNIVELKIGDNLHSSINPYPTWKVSAVNVYGKVVLEVVYPVRLFGIINDDYTEKELLEFMYKVS